MGNTTEIIIDDGVQEYTFKNKLGEVFARFSFNPADTGIIKRYEKVIEYFNSVSVPEDKDAASQIVSLDDLLKEQFNTLCGKNVSDGLFMQYTPLTLFVNGDFYAEVVIEQIGKIIEAEIGTRLDRKKAKIRRDIARARYDK